MSPEVISKLDELVKLKNSGVAVPVISAQLKIDVPSLQGVLRFLRLSGVNIKRQSNMSPKTKDAMSARMRAMWAAAKGHSPHLMAAE